MAAQRARNNLDLGTILGLVLACGTLFAGIALDHGRISDILQLPAALIVFGGTFGAVLISTPLRQVVEALRCFRMVIFQSAHDLLTTTEQLVEFATKARREGIIALEEEADAIEDPAFRRCVELAIDGLNSDELRKMVEIDIHAQESRAEDMAKVYEAAGGYAPTIGILGAVLGLIQVMQNLGNIEEVGHGIAVAFVATIYGVASANLLFLPAASKIRIHALRRSELMQLVGEGVIGIVEGMNPRMLRRKLNPLAAPIILGKSSPEPLSGTSEGVVP